MVLDPKGIGSRSVEHKINKGEFINATVLPHDEISISLSRAPGDGDNI